VTDFIATLGPGKSGNWDICKRESLWGIVGRGTNWRKNGERVAAGDRIFVWRSGRNNGFIAQTEALGSIQLVGKLGIRVPWPEPEWFGAVVPIRVITELGSPATDIFLNENGRVGTRFGFNNTALQHIFEEVSPAIASKIAAAFSTVD
jgi:hypothetical protein